MSFSQLIHIEVHKDLKIMGYFFFLFFVIISFFFGLILTANFLYITQSERTITELSKNSSDVIISGSSIGIINNLENYSSTFEKWHLLTNEWLNKQFNTYKNQDNFSSIYISHTLSSNQISFDNQTTFSIQLFNKTLSTYVLGIDQNSFESLITNNQSQFLLITSNLSSVNSQDEKNLTSNIEFSWMTSRNTSQSIVYYNLSYGEITTNSTLINFVSSALNSRFLQYNSYGTYLLFPINEYSIFLKNTSKIFLQIFNSSISFSTKFSFRSEFKGADFWANFPQSLQLVDDKFINSYIYDLEKLYENNLSNFAISESYHDSPQISPLISFDNTFKDLIIPFLLSISILLLLILFFHFFYIFELIKEDPIKIYSTWFLIVRGASRLKISIIFISELCLIGLLAIGTSLSLFSMLELILNIYTQSDLFQLMLLGLFILLLILVIQFYEYWSYLNKLIIGSPTILSPKLYETNQSINYPQTHFSIFKRYTKDFRFYAIVILVSILSTTSIYTYMSSNGTLSISSFLIQLVSSKSINFILIIIIFIFVYLFIGMLFFVLLRIFLSLIIFCSKYIKHIGYLTYKIKIHFKRQYISLLLISSIFFILVFSSNFLITATNYDSFQFLNQHGADNVAYLTKNINGSLTIGQISNEIENILSPMENKNIPLAYQLELTFNLGTQNVSTINGRTALSLTIAIPSNNYFDIVKSRDSYQILEYTGNDLFSNSSSAGAIDNSILIQKDQLNLLNLSSSEVPYSWFNLNVSKTSNLKINGTFMYWPELVDFLYKDNSYSWIHINAIMGWNIAKTIFKNASILSLMNSPSSPSITLYLFSSENQLITNLSDINPFLSNNGWIWNPCCDYLSLANYIDISSLGAQILPIWNYFALIFIFLIFLVNIILNNEVFPIFDRRIYRLETVLGVEKKNLLFYDAIQLIISDILSTIIGIVIGIFFLYLFVVLNLSSTSQYISQYFNMYYTIFMVNIEIQPTLYSILIIFLIDIILRVITSNHILNILKLTRPIWDD